MKYIDDKSKKNKWYYKNVFYVGTLLITLLNIFAYIVGGINWVPAFIQSSWTDVLNFNNIFCVFLSAFEHANLQHCLLNCICFLVAGTYLERKIGTFNLFVLVVAFAYFCGCAVSANYPGYNHGFSGVNYGLYAYIIFDYVFLLINKKHDKVNIIYGAIIVALIYLACCFSGGTTSFGFKWYPYDLITNMGHYTSFVTGTIITLLVKFIKWETIN